MIIAFDFDGTITKRNEYPNCGELREGIKRCINKLHKQGHSIIIFTCRSAGTIIQIYAYIEMIHYLSANDIHFDTINSNINPNKDFNPIKP